MAHARLCQVEQNVIDVQQQCKVSCSSLISCEETEKSSTTKTLQSCLQSNSSPKPSLILTVCKNGKEYSMRKRENKSTKRPSNRLEETQKSKRRHLEDFPLVLTPVCSSFNLQSQDSIYSPIIITPCTSNLNDITTEISGMPITPKSSSEISASCDEFSQSDSEEPSSVATVDSRTTQNTRHRSNSNIVQTSSEVSTPVIPLTSSTITPYSSTTTCSITSQFDSLSSPSSPLSSCHPSENYTDDEINVFFNSWMDCYELKKKQFINSRNKL